LIDLQSQYSGALFVPEKDSDTGSQSTRIRPDTPDPEAHDSISVDEMDDCLLEAARQNSIRDQVGQLAAEEAPSDDPDIDVHADIDTYPSRSPTPEYNEYNILTACSKGKNRTN
jgi:hypothetical protein